ncbi:hypothetical protein K493DRAFT_290441 [Basidiobolus meristosporus CBS 931.73]|uniref:Cyclin N-terminal domain-containing protein n=1 Tax=Basidiobolus meristosporus CBS 931.73 TaxID=1314790 RepID=A0A1Y1XS06_9FUNG|nr:hypothetical protein K493DRAFT_290441 [Basidiobolus meristosporus CBS 931.73]|eukprot:ORX88538.1 hypothetical protein K493DRAFT_290441 [Basidiobolus meristosporus CBS 931.73]
MSHPELTFEIAYVTATAASVIKCTSLDGGQPSFTNSSLPPSSPSHIRVPSLKRFIMELAAKSKVHTPSFLCTLVYLDRLKKRLPEFARGTACTCHRIFLATLIITSKYLNDASPKNFHWAQYTPLFSLVEVNLMERQLLELLDYDLRITPEELHQQFAGLWVGMHHPARAPVNDQYPTPSSHHPRKRSYDINTYVEAALKKYRIVGPSANIKSLFSLSATSHS